MAGLLATIALLTFGAATSAAANLGVSTTGANTGNCVDDPCLTIQYAIDQATAGDTINVAAGTYSERITVDEEVNLRGAQAGVDARNRTGPETIVKASAPYTGNVSTFAIAADNIQIDGFTITQDAARTDSGMGIVLPLNVSSQNLSVLNNIISNNQYGMAGFSPGANADISGMRVHQNLFNGNNKDNLGAVTTDGMFMPSRIGDTVEITDNRFEDTFAPTGDGAAINIGGIAGDPMTGLEVSGNSSENDYTFLVHNYGTGAVITDNEISDETGTSVYIGGNADGTQITDNTIRNGSTSGIRLTDMFGTASPVNVLIRRNVVTGMGTNGLVMSKVAGAGDMHDIVVSDNRFDGNTVGIRTEGDPDLDDLLISANSLTGNGTGVVSSQTDPLVVENNWWGCNAGPGNSGCDTTTGPVDSAPHLQLSVSTGQNAVGLGGTTPVSATFERNSDGQTVPVPVLDGTMVNFSATGGSVNPASAVVDEGDAATTFTGSDPGPATVTANVGAVSAETTITVTGTAPTVSAPALSGSGRVGQALTCTPGNATGGNPAPSVETVLLANGAAIPGQSGLSYTPVESDVGKSITCRTTATNSVGSASQTSPAVTVTAVPVDPPKPPVVTPIKKTADVPKSGKVVVTTVKCPEGNCTVKAPKTIKVKIGGKTYTAKVKVQKNVAEGESAKVTIVLPKKARKAIKGKSGKAKLKITVTSSDGKKKTLNQTIKLKGKKR